VKARLDEHKLNLVYLSLLSLNEPVYHSKLQFPYLPMLDKAGTKHASLFWRYITDRGKEIYQTDTWHQNLVDSCKIFGRNGFKKSCQKR